jgi:hypothetical protein
MSEILDHWVCMENNVVRLWTTKYIRFDANIQKKAEKEKCWAKKVRTELSEELLKLGYGNNRALRGTYWSNLSDHEREKLTRKNSLDIENLVFYNIIYNKSSLNQLYSRGLVFEGLPQWLVEPTKVSIPIPPRALKAACRDYYEYELADIGDQEPRLWQAGRTLARWEDVLFESTFFRSAIDKACVMWSALKAHIDNIDTCCKMIEKGSKFGIWLRLSVPEGMVLDVSSGKSLMDGVIAAFQECNNNKGSSWVANEISGKSEGMRERPSREIIEKYLTSDKYHKMGVLFPGNIRKGNKWDPCDEICVFGSVVLDNIDSRDCMFSGNLFEIRERKL